MFYKFNNVNILCVSHFNNNNKNLNKYKYYFIHGSPCLIDISISYKKKHYRSSTTHLKKKSPKTFEKLSNVFKSTTKYLRWKEVKKRSQSEI